MTDPYAEGAHARITAALEPDPTPALGWRAMQTAAAEHLRFRAEQAQQFTTSNEHCSKSDVDRVAALADMVRAFALELVALPGPTDEQALAEALRLREVQAMVTDMRELREVVQNICGEDALDRELIRAAMVRIEAAIAKIETVRGQGYRLSEALSAHVHPSTRNKASETPWSPKEDKILREMKTSWSELWTIAEELERSEQAIIERLRILEC